MSYVFIVMEYFESDLSTLMDKTGKLQFHEEHVITIFYNILCAINMVHTSNVMHRDVKPENILVDQYCHIRLCDFGFARPVSEYQQEVVGNKSKIHQTLLK